MTEQDLKEINFNTAVLLTYLEVLNGFSIWHQEEHVTCFNNNRANDRSNTKNFGEILDLYYNLAIKVPGFGIRNFNINKLSC